MSTNVFLPTKVRLRKCNIAGVDMRLHTQSIKAYESMCTPYIKSEITIIDNNNVINGIGLVGGEEVNFAFDAGENVYQQKQYVHTIKAHPSEKNKRVQVYQIGTIGEAYMKDRASLVQESDVNVPATSVAEKIHNIYLGKDAPLKNLMSSLGMIAKDTIGSYITSNVKPFKGIEDALNRATYGQYKSGATVYFRNAHSYVMSPLELLFRTASPNFEFIEKATWGVSINDIFEAHNAVIAASLIVEDGKPGSTTVSERVAASSQELKIWDTKLKNYVQDIQAKASGGLASLLNFTSMAAGKHGGILNVLQHDPARNNLSSDPSMNRIQHKEFLSKVKDSPKYYVKVPIKGGLKCTVGEGVGVKLMPPAGDQNIRIHNQSGTMLVADLMHECYFDARPVMGTTTFRGVSVKNV